MLKSARLSFALVGAMAVSSVFAQTAPGQAGGSSHQTSTQGSGGMPGTPASAPNAVEPGKAPMVADADFVKMASGAGMAEVSLGQLAVDKGQSPAVKQFGQQMVTDHTKANEQLIALAKQKGAAVAAEPTTADRNAAAKIGAMSGADFDKAFSARMVMDHKKVIALFEKESKSGKDADLKAFATQTLPTLQQHLQMAQALPAGTGGH